MKQEQLTKALKRVQEQTAKDGNEHLLMLDCRDGSILREEHGTATCVRADRSLAGRDGLVIVHSHPGDAPLSTADIDCGFSFAAPIYSISPNNWVSWADGRKPGCSPWEFQDTCANIQDAIIRRMEQNGFKLNMDIEKATKADIWVHGLCSHVLNLVLMGKGFVQYGYTMPQSLLARLNSELTAALRLDSEQAGKLWKNKGLCWGVAVLGNGPEKAL